MTSVLPVISIKYQKKWSKVQEIGVMNGPHFSSPYARNPTLSPSQMINSPKCKDSPAKKTMTSLPGSSNGISDLMKHGLCSSKRRLHTTLWFKMNTRGHGSAKELMAPTLNLTKLAPVSLTTQSCYGRIGTTFGSCTTPNTTLISGCPSWFPMKLKVTKMCSVKKGTSWVMLGHVWNAHLGALAAPNSILVSSANVRSR